MNRSFTQSQQIDCACFNFGLSEQPFTRNRSETLKPLLNTRLKNIYTQPHPKISLKQHAEFKKTLNKKYLNESTKQVNSSKPDFARKMVRHQSTNTEWTGEIKEYQRIAHKMENIFTEKSKNIQERECVNKKTSKQFKTQIESIWGKQNKYAGQKPLNNQVSVPNLKINFNGNLEASFDQTIKQQTFQRNKLKSVKQNEFKPVFAKKVKYQKNKSSIHYIDHIDPSQIDSQQKTIKKRHSVLSMLYNIRQTYTNKNLDSSKHVPQESLQNMKRGSIRADKDANFIKQLQNIFPKEIESFDQENVSAAESEVIEKGRNTWAPNCNSNTKGQNFHFISSLHINTNRTSNRPSKMIPGTDDI